MVLLPVQYYVLSLLVQSRQSRPMRYCPSIATHCKRNSPRTHNIPWFYPIPNRNFCIWMAIPFRNGTNSGMGRNIYIYPFRFILWQLRRVATTPAYRSTYTPHLYEEERNLLRRHKGNERYCSLSPCST